MQVAQRANVPPFHVMDLLAAAQRRQLTHGDLVNFVAGQPSTGAPKAVLLPAGELGGFSLAALARVTLPTGDPTSYISEGSTTGELRLLSELNLVAFSLRATAGARVRGAAT